MILIDGLNKSIGKKKILNDISLDLKAGQIVGLLGPNGSGKTTLLKILAGLSSDYSGVIQIDALPIGPQTKTMISYLPEHTYLLDWMRVSDALDFFEDFYSDFSRVRADEMLKQLHIDPRQRIKTMSKGMQEKLQLILVMSRQAKIFLLDEPIGGVDPATRSAVLDAFIQLYQEDSLMIIATHLISDIERVFDRVIFIDEGSIKLDEHVDVLRHKYNKSVDAHFREVFSCSVSL